MHAEMGGYPSFRKKIASITYELVNTFIQNMINCSLHTRKQELKLNNINISSTPWSMDNTNQ